jgi:hypothetical protein
MCSSLVSRYNDSISALFGCFDRMPFCGNSGYNFAAVLVSCFNYPVSFPQCEVDDRSFFFEGDLRIFLAVWKDQGSIYGKRFICRSLISWMIPFS